MKMFLLALSFLKLLLVVLSIKELMIFTPFESSHLLAAKAFNICGRNKTDKEFSSSWSNVIYSSFSFKTKFYWRLRWFNLPLCLLCMICINSDSAFSEKKEIISTNKITSFSSILDYPLIFFVAVLTSCKF